MTKITMDPILSSKLGNAAGVVELCDPSGRLLGRFVPHWRMADWESRTPEPCEDELLRREQEMESYSTSELIAHLENLKCRSRPEVYLQCQGAWKTSP
jgi:hypothetical protein